MKTITVNGVNITMTHKEYAKYIADKKKLLEDAQRKMRELDNKELLDANKALNKIITKSLINEKSEIKQKVLKTMIKDFTTKEDLDYRTWLYNDGKLRSNWEVEEYEAERKKALYRSSTNFDTSSKMTNTICFIIPFTFCFAAVMSKPDAKSLWFIYLPIALLLASFFCFISMMIGYSLNIKRGKRKGLEDTDQRMLNEKYKRNLGAVTGAISGVSTYHHAKRSLKDFMNVESWKELK